MELFVDDLVECHGDVRVRAMMVPCRLRSFGFGGGSGIYCDTLSVSQYDSKVRSGLCIAWSLNNLFYEFGRQCAAPWSWTGVSRVVVRAFEKVLTTHKC